MYNIRIHTNEIKMTQGLDPALLKLKQRAKGNELTYGFVMDCLSDYSSPRAKLTRLLESEALIRVKKGLYTFGEMNAKGPICKELLANLIYGPSYVSLEWALAYYGFIPERVYEVTSITSKQKKHFDTPLGRFSYTHTHSARYPIGITQGELSPFQKFLIASPEKALADLLITRRGKTTSLKRMEQILFQDLRIDEEQLSLLDINLIKKLQEVKPHSAIQTLLNLLETKNS